MASNKRRDYEAVIALGGKISPSLKKSLSHMMQNMDVLNKKVKKQDKSFLNLNKTMKSVAKIGLTAFGGKILIDQMGKTITAAADLQTGMSKVATLVDGSVNKVMGKYNGLITENQLLTGQMTDVSTNGLYEVISAFGESADTAGQFTIAMKSATAGTADVAETVKLLSAVTKGYGDTSVEAQKKASDLAFKTVELGQTTFPELASSMGKVISLAQPLKVSQEELFAGFATLTGVTGDTAEAATQLAAINKAFLSPTSDMQKVIEDMGFSTGAAAVQAMGYQKTLALMREEVDGNAVAFSNLFGRAEAKTAALALTGAQADTFVNKLSEMENAAGAMESAFDKRSQGFDVILARAQRLQEVLRRQIGLKALPLVNKGLKFIVENFDSFSKGIDVFMKGLSSLQVPIKWLGTVAVMIYNSLRDAINRNRDSIVNAARVAGEMGQVLAAAFQAAEPIITWLIDVGIAGVIDGLAMTIEWATAIWDVFSNNWTLIAPIVGGATAAIVAYKIAVNLAWIQTAIGVAWLTAWNVVAGIGAAVTGALAAAIAFLTSPIGLVVLAIGLLVAALIALWQNWDTVVAALGKAWEDFRAGFTMAIDKIVEKWENFKNAIGDGLKRIGNGIKKIFGGGSKSVEMTAAVKTSGFDEKVPAFAKGVTNFSGGPAIVGDGGPEFLNLPRGTDVTSVSETAKLMGNARSRVTDLVERVKSTNVTKVFRIVYAPVIHAGDSTGVEEALSESYEQFLQYMNRFKRENEDTDLSFQGA